MLTIGRKLLIGKIVILGLLSIIVISSIYAINNLSKTANKMETEYLEVKVVQELQISFQRILLSLKSYLINGGIDKRNNYKYHYTNITTKLTECKKIITQNHKKELLEDIEKDIIKIDILSKKLFEVNTDLNSMVSKSILGEISLISRLAIKELNIISNETKSEMNKYIEINNETNKRSKRLIMIIGIITACFLIIGGFFFIKSIISPLNSLIKSTQKVSLGNLSFKTDIKTHDELGKLMESFNKMIGILDRTTVSRDYFDNILSRMDDSLIITDDKNNIVVVNQATLNLLGYAEEEIIGKSFETILGENIDKEAFIKSTIIRDLKEQKHLHTVYNIYYSKKGDKIPVLFSGSLMYDEKGLIKGMICIANNHIVENSKIENTISSEYEKDIESQTIKTVGEIPLSKRERQIMKLIAEELSNQEIADKLYISIRTVETHRKNIMQKLHTKSVIALVKYAALNGII